MTRMWRKENTYSLLLRVQTNETTVDISAEVLQKVGNKPTTKCSYTILGYIP